MSIKLDAAILKKIANMSLIAKYAAEGSVSGLHQSPFRGSNLEFAQHRQYSPGDELKHIDWKVYGRTDRYYIKLFEQETNHRAYSIMDISASMSYGSHSISKLEYAAYLSAAMSYLMIHQRDSAGLITFSDNLKEFLAANNSKDQFKNILKNLENITSAGQSDFAKSLRAIGKKIKKRSLLMLFSDLLEEPDKIVRTLKFFPYMKHDLIVFHILDPEEIHLKQKGLVQYVDMETGVKLKTRPEIIRKVYIKKMEEYLKKMKLEILSHNIQYHLITTDTALEVALNSVLATRRKSQ